MDIIRIPPLSVLLLTKITSEICRSRPHSDVRLRETNSWYLQQRSSTRKNSRGPVSLYVMQKLHRYAYLGNRPSVTDLDLANNNITKLRLLVLCTILQFHHSSFPHQISWRNYNGSTNTCWEWTIRNYFRPMSGCTYRKQKMYRIKIVSTLLNIILRRGLDTFWKVHFWQQFITHAISCCTLTAYTSLSRSRYLVLEVPEWQTVNEYFTRSV